MNLSGLGGYIPNTLYCKIGFGLILLHLVVHLIQTFAYSILKESILRIVTFTEEVNCTMLSSISPNLTIYLQSNTFSAPN